MEDASNSLFKYETVIFGLLNSLNLL